MDALRAVKGLPFTKMTGSGNDFVFFDGREVDASLVTRPEVVQAICNRHNGIGGDGVVVLEPGPRAGEAVIHYFNSDGSAADLCGNATLCSTFLSVQWGLSDGAQVGLHTPAGVINARLDTLPQIQLGSATIQQVLANIELEATEQRVGFVKAGIPHLVVLVDSASEVDVSSRGPVLRRHAATGAAGANVNWVSPLPDGRWRYRTFERGVEGETLACGTGAVATAVQLVEWGLASSPVTILSSSGRDLVVDLETVGRGEYRPILRGEGRLVFTGVVGELG